MTARPQSETTNGREPRAGSRGETGGTRSQVLFRDLNEHLRSLAKGFGLDAEFDLVCECRNGGCFERVTIRLGEYEAIRRFPTRFVVNPGHAAAAVERIVEETSLFLVVEKIGPEAEIDDPARPAQTRLTTAADRMSAERAQAKPAVELSERTTSGDAESRPEAFRALDEEISSSSEASIRIGPLSSSANAATRTAPNRSS